MVGRSPVRQRPLRSIVSAVAIGALLVACGGDSGDGNGDGSSGGDAPANEAQAIFIEVGCAECHGEEGEGATAGSLQGTRTILAAFSTRVRNGRGEAMPAYSPEQISDEEIAMIHEWLRSQ